MAKLRSLHDLTRIRETSRRMMKMRVNTGTSITIGAGTCGLAAGARETIQAIEEELAKRHIEARVSTVGCIGMCAKEPLVDIRQAGGAHILYANIQPEMVGRLVEQHLVNGEPVKEWVICTLPGE
jgi:NADP-reducing hydrogenase subunit HndB